MERLYIDSLTDAQIVELEKTLRPGKSSAAGFLGIDERLKDIIYEDAKTLNSLGITHRQVADRLEQVIGNQLASEDYIVKPITYRGCQHDPFQERRIMHPYSNMDFVVTNPREGQIKFPGLIITLIRDYQFFEGKETPYRLDPKEAVRVLNIKPGEDYPIKISPIDPAAIDKPKVNYR